VGLARHVAGVVLGQQASHGSLVTAVPVYAAKGFGKEDGEQHMSSSCGVVTRTASRVACFAASTLAGWGSPSRAGGWGAGYSIKFRLQIFVTAVPECAERGYLQGR
jgi:hypothetical protein